MAKAPPINDIKDCVSLAAATFYPSWPVDRVDKVRGDLAIKTIREIKNKGFSLFISDSGSSEKFLS